MPQEYINPQAFSTFLMKNAVKNTIRLGSTCRVSVPRSIRQSRRKMVQNGTSSLPTNSRAIGRKNKTSFPTASQAQTSLGSTDRGRRSSTPATSTVWQTICALGGTDPPPADRIQISSSPLLPLTPKSPTRGLSSLQIPTPRLRRRRSTYDYLASPTAHGFDQKLEINHFDQSVSPLASPNQKVTIFPSKKNKGTLAKASGILGKLKKKQTNSLSVAVAE